MHISDVFRIFAVMKRSIITIITIIFTLGLHAQVQCEDTCSHVHGIDLSHYQGNVFWETVGDNSKMAYVYLKATEGGTNVDAKYKKNIDQKKVMSTLPSSCAMRWMRSLVSHFSSFTKSTLSPFVRR